VLFLTLELSDRPTQYPWLAWQRGPFILSGWSRCKSNTRLDKWKHCSYSPEAKHSFERIVEKLYWAIRCWLVRLLLRRKWTDLDEIWRTVSTDRAKICPGRSAICAVVTVREAAEIFLCQVNNARFRRFLFVGPPIYFTTFQRSVRRWKCWGQNFENFTARRRFL